MFGTLNVLVAVLRVTTPAAEDTVRVVEMDSFHGAAVRRAVEGAVRRLEAADCQKIFVDFRDAAGTPLQSQLDAYGVSAANYLRWIVFTDGSGHRACSVGGTLAITSPGSRVVLVCSRRFYEAQIRQPMMAELALIHEALHSLGLRENPPSTYDITRGVESRCHVLPRRPLLSVVRSPQRLP